MAVLSGVVVVSRFYLVLVSVLVLATPTAAVSATRLPDPWDGITFRILPRPDYFAAIAAATPNWTARSDETEDGSVLPHLALAYGAIMLALVLSRTLPPPRRSRVRPPRPPSPARAPVEP